MHEKYMRLALDNASKAYDQGDVPVGCVIVHNDEVIASTYNKRHQSKSPLAHAEMEAIEIATNKLGVWILDQCTMYVTLEPCPMCSGAIVQSRINTLVFGAREPKSGYVVSLHQTLNDANLNHQVNVVEGILQKECSQIMKNFFKELRSKKKQQRIEKIL